MLNHQIFNLDPANLRAKIFGTDGQTEQAVHVNTEGALKISTIKDPVTIEANNLEIRQLSPAQDGISIYGHDGHQNQILATDSQGYLLVKVVNDDLVKNLNQTISLSNHQFIETEYLNLITYDNYTSIPAVNISQQADYSFFVVNRGENRAQICLEISPDNKIFHTDLEPFALDNQRTTVISALHFLKYTRLSYRSLEPELPTMIDIYFQAQT